MSKIINFNSIKATKSTKSSNPSTLQHAKNKLFILIGIPCSGKSTYSKKFLYKTNTLVVSSDEIRKELTGTYKYSSKNNESVFKIAKTRIYEALSDGYDVVWDATNLNEKHRKDFIKIGKITNSELVAVVFNIPLQVCLNRNSQRDFEIRLPDTVIKKMATANLNIDESEGFNDIIFKNN